MREGLWRGWWDEGEREGGLTDLRVVLLPPHSVLHTLQEAFWSRRGGPRFQDRGFGPWARRVSSRRSSSSSRRGTRGVRSAAGLCQEH